MPRIFDKFCQDKTQVSDNPSEQPADVKFEIGHVLFIDIVGYSKLLITKQSEQIQTLRRIVRGTEQFRLAEAQGKLVRLPTGDGGATCFPHQSGGACSVRTGNRKGAEESSPPARTYGRSQWAG